MKIQRRTFSGGYCFKRFEGESGLEVFTADIPSQVAIPLKQGLGYEATALVRYGDAVKAGQIIGRLDSAISSPIHSSVNGTVDAVKTIDYFGEKIQTVFITADGSPDWQPLEGHSAQWQALPVSKIEELLYLSGVTSLGSSGIPTNYKSSIISPLDVEHLIIHHTEAEVFNESLLFKDERLIHFVEGLIILRTLMRNAKLHVAFSFPQSDRLFQIADLVKDREAISYYSLKPKYPQHREEVLIPTILQKKVPYGYLPANIGVVTFTVQDVLHVYDAVVNGKPLIERWISLAGPGFEDRPYLRVRIGTALQDVVTSRMKQDQEYRFIVNSITTGKTLPDLSLPVTKEYRKITSLVEKREGDFLSFMQPGFRDDSYSNTFASLLLPFKKRLTTNISGEQRACISCGFCSECCPAGLYPNLLHRYVEREKFDEPLVRFGIFDCIDCNLCTYVCPSKIPVARLLKQGKEKLIEEGFYPYEQTDFVDMLITIFNASLISPRI